jgi:hypothetical protein
VLQIRVLGVSVEEYLTLYFPLTASLWQASGVCQRSALAAEALT